MALLRKLHDLDSDSFVLLGDERVPVKAMRVALGNASKRLSPRSEPCVRWASSIIEQDALGRIHDAEGLARRYGVVARDRLGRHQHASRLFRAALGLLAPRQWPPARPRRAP